MILLDAYALVAFLVAEEPAAEEVDALLRRGPCSIGVVNLAEAVDVSERLDAVTVSEVRQVVRMLVGTGRLEVIEAGEELAWRAAAVRRAYYARRTCEISLPDCLLLAGATTGDEIATADPAVATVARAEGLAVVPLPDLSGQRP